MNVNVNQMASQTKPVSSCSLSCLEILKTLTAIQVIHYWIESIPLYLQLFPRKRRERKEMPNIFHHDRSVLLRISILDRVDVIIRHLNNSEFLELRVSHQERQSVWTSHLKFLSTDVNIPSGQAGITWYRPNFNIWVAASLTELSGFRQSSNLAGWNIEWIVTVVASSPRDR